MKIDKSIFRVFFCTLLCFRFWTEQIDSNFGTPFSALITMSIIFLALVLIFLDGIKNLNKFHFFHLFFMSIILLQALILLIYRTPKYLELTSVQQILKFFSYVSIFIVTIKLFRNKNDFYWLGYAILIGLGVSCLVAIVQKVTGTGFVDVGGLRPYGLSSHPALFALQIVLSSSFLYCLNKDKVVNNKSFVLITLFFIAFVALYLSQARTSWAVFLIVCFYYVWKTGRFGAGALISVSILLLMPLLAQRLEDLSGVYDFVINEEYKTIKYYTVVESSFHWRLLHWYRLIEIGSEYPYFGHGPGLTLFLNEFNKEAHNSFIEFYVEQGLLGLLMFSLLIISVIYKVFSSVDKKDTASVIFGGYLLGILFAMTFGQGVFNETHVMQMSIVFYCYTFFKKFDNYER